MKFVMNPGALLGITVACVVIALLTYLEGTHTLRPDHGIGGLVCGLFVMGGASLLAAVHLHKKP